MGTFCFLRTAVDMSSWWSSLAAQAQKAGETLRSTATEATKSLGDVPSRVSRKASEAWEASAKVGSQLAHTLRQQQEALESSRQEFEKVALGAMVEGCAPW